MLTDAQIATMAVAVIIPVSVLLAGVLISNSQVAGVRNESPHCATK